MAAVVDAVAARRGGPVALWGHSYGCNPAMGGAAPRWPSVIASAPTLPRECRVEDGWRYEPGQFDGISAPTLMLTGSATDPALAECTNRAAAAIPNTKIRILDGHGHFAYKTAPALVAAIIRDFITT